MVFKNARAVPAGAHSIDGVSAPMLGKDVKYGLGVIIRPARLGLTYGHSGFFPGYTTGIMYFPDGKISVAVQVNSSVSPNLGKPSARVLAESAEMIFAENPAENKLFVFRKIKIFRAE